MEIFKNVIGYDKEKQELMQVCDMVTDPQKYAVLGVRLPRGVLLHGEPGVGKTLMATDLINAMGRKIFTIRRNKSNDKFVDHIGEVFAEAKNSVPSVVFLDDMDKFAHSKYGSPEEFTAVQAGIDAVNNSDVFVIATANDIDDIPQSLLRSGRFDRIIEVCAPRRKDAVEIVRHYLSGKKVANDVTAELVARLMDGHSCADLESVLNEAGIYAGFDGCAEIGRTHIMRAVLRNIFEAEDGVNEISAALKQEVAFHEAGHVAVAYIFEPESVGIVSIRSCSNDERGVVQLLKSDDYFGSYEKMYQRVLVLLAGRAVTELKFGRTDVGAESDLSRATAIIQRFVCKYGASGLHLLRADSDCDLEYDGNDRAVIDETNAMLARMYEEVKAILRKNWDKVELVAAALAERGTLLFEDIVELLGDKAA